MSLKGDPFAVWNYHTVFIQTDKHIVKYSEDTFLDLLLENEDDSTSWFDGRAANIIGIDESKVVDVRPSNEYYIEDYDLEKSVKRRYKVILEETLDMDEHDHHILENSLKENDDG